MILTEDEAKTKRCQESFGDTNLTPHGHMVPAPNYSGVALTGSSMALATSPSMCIASACMAWRWHEYDLDPVDRRRLSGKTGYCGKAGRP